MATGASPPPTAARHGRARRGDLFGRRPYLVTSRKHPSLSGECGSMWILLMIDTSLRPACPTVILPSESKFVSYPPTSQARARTVEAVVLRTLADDRVAAPDRSPLVAITRVGLDGSSNPTDSYRSRTHALKIDMGNSLGELGETLLPPPSHIPNPGLLRKRQLILDETYLHALLSPWESKSELDKMLITANAMPAELTLTFTVNFSQRRQRSLGADLGVAFKKLRNELGCIASLGPTLATLEHDDRGRLHLHGMVATQASEAELRQLLLKLGGVSENQAFRNLRQVKIKPATSPLGWGLYMTKDLLRMPPDESGSHIYASQQARRLGKAHLEELREASRTKLSIRPDLRGRAGACRRPSQVMRRDTGGGRRMH